MVFFTGKLAVIGVGVYLFVMVMPFAASPVTVFV